MLKKQEIEALLSAINDLDTDKSILLSEALLEEGYSVKNYYLNVLLVSLIGYSCSRSRKECLWDLYLRESLINTLIELSTKYILIEKEKDKNKKVLVVSPVKGLDVFAKLYANYYKLCGYNAIYLGDLLDNGDFLDSIHILKPNIISFHISTKDSMVNVCHLVKTIQKKLNIKTYLTSDFPINESNLSQISHDVYIREFSNIEKLGV